MLTPLKSLVIEVALALASSLLGIAVNDVAKKNILEAFGHAALAVAMTYGARGSYRTVRNAMEHPTLKPSPLGR